MPVVSTMLLSTIVHCIILTHFSAVIRYQVVSQTQVLPGSGASICPHCAVCSASAACVAAAISPQTPSSHARIFSFGPRSLACSSVAVLMLSNCASMRFLYALVVEHFACPRQLCNMAPSRQQRQTADSIRQRAGLRAGAYI